MKEKTKTISLNILKNILNCIAALLIIIISSKVFQLICLLLKDHFYLISIAGTIIYLALILLIGCLYAKKVIKIDLSEFGLSFSSIKNMGIKNIFWAFFGLLIPCLVLFIYFVFIPGNFSFNENANLSRILVYAIFSTGLWAGIGEEFVFRGILFKYMQKTLGTVVAVLVPSIVFGAIHIMNMQEFNAIDVIQLLLGGTSVAILFSLIYIKSGSLIPGMFFHSCWNILIIGSIFGVGDIVNGIENNAIIQYRLKSSNHLLTGGNFGIEISLPAILIFISASIFLVYLIKKENKKQQTQLITQKK